MARPEAGVKVTPEEVEGEEKPGGKRKMIPIMVGILLVQVVVAYFLVTKFFPPAQRQPQDDHPLATEANKRGVGSVYLLEDIIVNPAGTGGNRYLVVSIAFEIPPEAKKLASEIETKEPMIRDRIIILLSSKRIQELIDIASRDSLRKEILQAVNRELFEGEVTWVYFTKYVLQ